MRLWHIDLIPYLPRQQLLGQWRELNSIYKNQPTHILINFVYGYPKEDLFVYSNFIIKEIKNRKYKINLENYFDYFRGVCITHELSSNNCFEGKMTNRYLKQCFYNLQEKYDCGGITEEEWLILSANNVFYKINN